MIVDTVTNERHLRESGEVRPSMAHGRGQRKGEFRGELALSGRRGRKLRVAAVAALACCLVMGGAYAAYASTFTDPKYAWYLEHENETEYTLTEPAQLYALANLVNGTAAVNDQAIAPVSFEGKTIKLANGMNLNIAGTSYEFVPIGTADTPFSGVFDGQGASVSGLRVTETTSDAGLFGYVSDRGAIENLTVNGEVSFSTQETVENVGGLVGDCWGDISNCTSNVNLSVESTFTPTEETPTSTRNVGGVAGHANGSLTGSTYQGLLTMNNDQDAFLNSEDRATPVALNVGGVVGLFGDDTLSTEVRARGNIDGCSNAGKLSLSFTGDGGRDRFGVKVISKPGCVGGIVGYSDGSISNCSNTNEIRTSSPGDDKYGYGTVDDNGAEQCGGIVGNLRNVVMGHTMSKILKADSGTSDDVLTVRNCYNTGLVIASNSVGGIVGTAGTYTVITECANGNYLENNKIDGTFDDRTKGAVITTRWNKPFAGGVVGNTNGSVTFCFNRSQVNNTQSGYYVAGIAGGLGNENLDTLETIKNDSDYQPEMYGCYNTGQLGLGHSMSYRFGALAGSNEGYIHDCVIKKGCIMGSTEGTDPSADGDSTAVGDASWGDHKNIHVLTADEMKTSDGLAQINAWCRRANGFQVYWYAADGQDGRDLLNDTYPVLNVWQEPVGAIDISLTEPQPSEVDYATYSSIETPVPSVKMTSAQVDGGILYQNVDFIVVPEEGATAITEGGDDPTPYTFGIKGIGKYSGQLSSADWKYGIGAGSLDEASVQVDQKTYNWEVQFPSGVHVLDAAGGEISKADYSYLIYDSQTYDLRNDGSPKYVVFDSAGTIQFLDDEGEPEGDPVQALGADTEGRAFKAYDRDGRLISDSDAKVYDPLTGKDVTNTSVPVVTASGRSTTVLVGQSCLLPKGSHETGDNVGPSGYVVQIIGKDDYDGSTTTGQYDMRFADFMRDCEYQKVTYTDPEDQTTTWKVNDNLKAYPSDGDPEKPEMKIAFTGDCIKPEVELSYLDKTLTLDEDVLDASGVQLYHKDGDYKYVYGPLETGTQHSNVDEPNRNVVDGGAVTVDAGFQSGFSSYVTFSFDIMPADIADCDIEPVSQAYTGDPVNGLVQVKLQGNVLVEGQDYTVSYVNEDTGKSVGADAVVDKGTYLATVSPKDNLVGTACTVEVQVGDPSTFAVADMDDITWTGADIYPKDYLDITDATSGKPLEYGRDYSYTISCISRSIEKDGSTTDDDVFLGKKDFDFIPAGYPYTKSNDSFYYIYTAHIVGNGLYAGTSDDQSFSILPLDISQTDPSDWEIEGAQFTWGSGNSGYLDRDQGKDPYKKIVYKGNILYESIRGSGYVKYMALPEDENNKQAGDQINRICVADNTTGKLAVGTITLDLDFPITILPADISQINVETTDSEPVYDGTAHRPITLHADPRYTHYTEGEQGDYTIDYSNNVNAGTATYVIRGVNNFTGSISGSFTIAPQNLSACTVEGGATVVVKNAQGTTLAEGTDYTVRYTAGSDTDTQIAYLTGIGNYTGEASTEVSDPTGPAAQLSVEDIPDQLVEAVTSRDTRADLVERDDGEGFTDQELSDALTGMKTANAAVGAFIPEDWPAGATPALSVKSGDVTLVAGIDYTVDYENNTNLGTAQAKVTGIGDYAGLSVEKDFQVTGYLWYPLDDSIDTVTKEVYVSAGFPTGSTYGQIVQASKFGASESNRKTHGVAIDGSGLAALTDEVEVSYAPDVTAGDPVESNSHNDHRKTDEWPPDSEVSVVWTRDGQLLGEGTARATINAMAPDDVTDLLGVEGAPTVAEKYLYTGAAQEVDTAGLSASSRVVTPLTNTSIAAFLFGVADGAADPQYYSLTPLGLDDAVNAGTRGVSLSLSEAWLARTKEGGDLAGRIVPADDFASSRDVAAAYIAPYDIADTSVYGMFFTFINFNGQFKNGLETAEVENDNASATGSPIEAQLNLTDKFGNSLVQGTDYTVSYRDSQGQELEGAPTDPGDYTVVVSGTVTEVNASTGAILAGSGNYTGVKELPFTIAPADIAEATVKAIPDQVWTGQAIEPVPEITYGEATLTKDVDYEISSYQNNTDLGQAGITLVGKGRFSGTLQVAFNIVKDTRYDLSTGVAVVNDASYTGISVADNVEVTVRDSSNALLDKTAYDVSFELKNVDSQGNVTWLPLPNDEVMNVGTYRVKVVGAGSAEDPTKYTGTAYAEFDITAADFSVADIASVEYDGDRHTPDPEVTMKEGASSLAKGTDYTVSYLDSGKNVIDGFDGYTDAGLYWVRITGVGNYSGTFDASFTITRASIADLSISAQAKNVYAGSPVEAQVSVAGLSLETDYRVKAYTDNAGVGYATVTVEGLGNYAGELSAEFKVQGDLALASIGEIGDQEYTGGSIKPSPRIDFAGTSLVEGTDYETSYRNNVQPGTATISIAGLGDWYVGTTSRTFAITAPMRVDDQTGVKASGTVFVDGAEGGARVDLAVSPLDGDDPIMASLISAYTSENTEVFFGYEVQLDQIEADGSMNTLRDGFGSLTLSFPVGSEFDGRTVSVVIRHVDDSGNVSLEQRTVTVSNGMATLTVDRLSEFLITVDKVPTGGQTGDQGGVQTGGTNVGGNGTTALSSQALAPTGDSVLPVIVGVLCGVFGLVGVLIARRKCRV